jgi:tetratricopeptide (TPR) repeat protein
VFDRLGKKAEAEAEYRRALEDPAYPSPEKVYLNLGLLYGSQGRDDEAIRELRKAVEIGPRYYRAHFELASRLESAGKFTEAASEYEVAAPDYTSSADYHYRLGFTYLKLKNNPKASEHLKRVIALSPGSENAAKAQDLLAMVR